jgi:hypothetical protein
MIMILNDVLTQYNVFSKLKIKDGDKELPKELKVKVMRLRMAFSKIKNKFDSDLQEFMSELVTPEFKELSGKSDKTEQETSRLNELAEQINSEYLIFINQKGLEEVTMVDVTFTEDEYADIVEVNAGNDIELNGKSVSAMDFLEAVYTLFVKE